ncbi:MAG: Dihydroorotase [Ignavibacteriae bacterium]|nr:MAG: Dihydroorotase [Ignavibacteriota bacterium]
MKLLFKNAHLINPAQKLNKVADILIIDGIIKKIEHDIMSEPDVKEYDLAGKIVAPGFVDMHVHLREPGYEHKETIETGLHSAAEGGFTAVCCMPNTNPPIDDASVVKSILQKAKDVLGGIIDVYPVAAATKGREGKELSPMLELSEAGAMAFSDDGSTIYNTEILRRALEYSSMLNRIIIQHPEDLELSRNGVINEGFISTILGLPGIPSIAEETIIERDIRILEYVDGFYHAAHISTRNSVEIIRNAKRKGLNVTCEVTPHHFTLSEEAVKGFDTNAKMKPPLRTQSDIEALIEGLSDGTIDVIATDHAPHSFDEKEVEFLAAPFGIVGLETAIGLALTYLVHKKHLTIEQLIEKFSINPRKILSLPEIKIEVGEKANLTIIDMNKKWTVDIQKFKSKSKNSPFHNFELVGKSIGIVNNGNVYFNE